MQIEKTRDLHDKFDMYAVTQGENSKQFSFTVTKESDKIEFAYTSYDSDEGVVNITYYPITGDVETIEEGHDVSIQTGSDVWSLLETQFAINAAIALHMHLGHGPIL